MKRLKWNFKTALVYLGIAAFCGLFAWIYQMNSHGVHSAFMTWMFVAPLVLGTAVFSVLGALGITWRNLGRTIYHSGVAALTVGCLMQGGLEIYGTNSKLIVVYFIAAGILLTLGVLVGIIWASVERRRA